MTQYILPNVPFLFFPNFHVSFTCPWKSPHFQCFIFKEPDQIKSAKCVLSASFGDVIAFFK